MTLSSLSLCQKYPYSFVLPQFLLYLARLLTKRPVKSIFKIIKFIRQCCITINLLISLNLTLLYHYYVWIRKVWEKKSKIDLFYKISKNYSTQTLACFAMISIRYCVLTLSTLGTKMLAYSGTWSVGYLYSTILSDQCSQVPRSTLGTYSNMVWPKPAGNTGKSNLLSWLTRKASICALSLDNKSKRLLSLTLMLNSKIVTLK